MTKEQDEALRTITEKNKICTYAMQVLGMDERRAEAFQKVAGDHLKWDGTLQFKTASGVYVAADDPQAKGFFEREYLGPVFGMTPKPEGDGKAPDVPADLIEKALAGNMTARAQIHRLRKDATPAATDKFLAEQRAKANSGNDDGGSNRSRDTGGRFVSDKDNPWTAAHWNLTEQMRVYRTDPALASRLANRAGVRVGATKPARVA